MSNLHVYAFNKKLMSLIDLLEEHFPNDALLQDEKRKLVMALDLCSTKAMSEFMKQIVVHGQQVDARDEAYFLEKCDDTEVAAPFVSERWGSLPQETRERVWDLVQEMKQLGTAYYLSP